MHETYKTKHLIHISSSSSSSFPCFSSRGSSQGLDQKLIPLWNSALVFDALGQCWHVRVHIKKFGEQEKQVKIRYALDKRQVLRIVKVALQRSQRDACYTVLYWESTLQWALEVRTISIQFIQALPNKH
jgi:hypothetical protein